MCFDFPVSKAMANVKSEWYTAVGPGINLGILTVLLEPTLLDCPGLVFGPKVDMGDTSPPIISSDIGNFVVSPKV